jgi:hypothetical protein
MGCANPEGATGANIARQIALRAGLPVTTSGMTVNRFCSSGLQTIALAAQRIIAGEGEIFVAGGVESISCVQQEMNQHMLADPWLVKNKPEIYWNMLQTAEQVAKRYGIGRERMDRYGAASQQKGHRGAGGGPVQGRDRTHHRDRRRGRQGAGPAQQARHRRGRRRHPRRHHLRGICNIRPALPGGVSPPAMPASSATAPAPAW